MNAVSSTRRAHDGRPHRFAGLRDAEKKVAELIFADIDFVAEANIGDIATRAKVSDASVTRFARAVGCTNVRDLKLRLTRALAAGRRFIQDAGDVVVTLSVSGYTPEIVESAQIARQYGARVVAITANGSPLAETADVVLPVVARETDFIYPPSASRYAMLAAIDVLALELALRHQDRSRNKLRRLKITLDAHRGGDNRQPLGD